MATGKRIRYNLEGGALGSALSDVDTTITFSSPPSFATIGANEYIALSLGDELAGYEEIVHLTAYTSGASTGTIERGQEGTTALAHNSGDLWIHAPTANDFLYLTVDASNQTNATDTVFQTSVAGDTGPRFYIDASGLLRWEDGAGGFSNLMRRDSNDTMFVYSSNQDKGLGVGRPDLNRGVYHTYHVSNDQARIVVTSVGGSGALEIKSHGTTFVPHDAVSVPVISKGAAAQTANLQEWHDSAGTLLFAIGPTGDLVFPGIGSFQNQGTRLNITPEVSFGTAGQSTGFGRNPNQGATVAIDNTNSVRVPLIVENRSGNANIQQWQDGSSNVLAQIDSAGVGTFGISGTTNVQVGGNGDIVFSGGSDALIEGPGAANLNIRPGSNIRNLGLKGSTGNTVLNIYGEGLDGATMPRGVHPSVTDATKVPLTVQGAAAQTGNLQEWQDSAGNTLTQVNADGSIFFPDNDVQTGLSWNSGANLFEIYHNGINQAVLNSGTGNSFSIRTNDNLAMRFGSDYIWSYFAHEARSASDVGIIVKGQAAQTANLQEWHDSAGTALAAIDSVGHLGLWATPGTNDLINASKSGNAVVRFSGSSDLGVLYTGGVSGNVSLTFSGGSVRGKITSPASTTRMEARDGSDNVRFAWDGTGIGFFNTTPVAQQAHPGTASGTDAAVINAIRDALINYGLLAAS